MLLSHTFKMFTQPDEEWKSIRREHSNPLKLYGAYIALLALISPVCAYISTTQFGWQVGDGQLTKLTTQSAFQLSAITYITMLIGVFGLGWMIDWMANTYGGKHDEYAANGIALAAYSATPLFLAGFALLYPEPAVNMTVFLIAATYSGYLIYDGLPIVMKINKDRAVLFSGAILTVALVYLVATRVGTVVIWSVGFGPEFIAG